MRFRLYSRGGLKSNGRPEEKHELRKYFHPQLKDLWSREPLNRQYRKYLRHPKSNEPGLYKDVGNFTFAPLVCKALHTIADIDILFLRPEEPGSLVTQGGDIDNRVKTLLDGLRMPKNVKELPDKTSPSEEENPFFCLLEDDALVTGLSVITDRLLNPTDPKEVLLLITVKIRVTETLMHNIALIGD